MRKRTGTASHDVASFVEAINLLLTDRKPRLYLTPPQCRRMAGWIVGCAPGTSRR